MLAPTTTGPLIREGQRHLAQWTLQPIANLIAAEASEKLDSQVSIDVMGATQAYDLGMRARSMNQIVQALALAKESGVSTDAAMALVNWAE
mgnify:CR=1 FL=1